MNKLLSITRHLTNTILYFCPPTRLFKFRLIMLRLASVDIDNCSKFCGRSWIYGKGSLKIMKNTWISPGAMIHTHCDAEIVIGNRCDIGPGVEIMTGSHEIGTSKRRAGKGIANPVFIGDGVWIGARSLILGGVTIGEGSVIAAGSVVTHSVGSNVLVAGVPARVKRILVK